MAKDIKTEDTSQSPGERLAERIVAALCADGLLDPAKEPSIRKKIARGTAKASDWRLWAEETVFPKDKHRESATQD